jgi:hypothetical protein
MDYTISTNLAETVMTRDTWLVLEVQFLRNQETRALHSTLSSATSPQVMICHRGLPQVLQEHGRHRQ